MPCGNRVKLSAVASVQIGREVGSCSTLVLWAHFVSKVMLIYFQCLADLQPKFPHMLCPNVSPNDNVLHSGLALWDYKSTGEKYYWKTERSCASVSSEFHLYCYYFFSPWRHWCVLVEHWLSWKSSWNQSFFSFFYYFILRSPSAGSAAGAEWCWHLLPPSKAPTVELKAGVMRRL